MRIQNIEGQDYRLPNALNDFQLRMYVHLIQWKWKHLTTEPGTDRHLEYDAILPDRYADEWPMLYAGLKSAIATHLQKFPFRIHTYFNHMASSQAANINLFLPILLHPRVDAILGAINPQFSRLARDYLDNGWRIEFWDEGFGALKDKSDEAGTDSDLGIAYYNHADELCLWLVEHKLTEPEFTTCGGLKSKGRRDKVRHDCTKSFTAILADKCTCYYHDVCRYRYWDITDAHRAFFVNHGKHTHCPFQGGMNQLWRNQLLALAIEQDELQPYEHAHVSVVRHPGNTSLDATLADYAELIGNNPRFSTFTSADVIDATNQHGDDALRSWVAWYKDLYAL